MARYDRDYNDYGWRPYVSVAARRQQARQVLRRLRQAGKATSPVEIAGRKIATTFWGTAWCDNLERYSDFANRLPRGRTYVRNGSVIDLQIGPGQVTALVSGSDIYTVTAQVTAVPAARWKAICRECAGGIDSLVELLQGRFSTAVMGHLCQQGTGLFPTPREIAFACSCPDWASMCKHVAAVLYGIGARLDHQPDLLFRLRQVDEQDLITHAGTGVRLSKKGPAASRVLDAEDLAGVFGVELAPAAPEMPPQAKRTRAAKPGLGKVAAVGAATLKAGAPKPAPPKPAKTARGAKAPTLRNAPNTPTTRKDLDVPNAPRSADRRAATAKPAQRRSPNGAQTGTPAFPAPPATWNAATRRAVSERMRRYWAERRRGPASRKKP